MSHLSRLLSNTVLKMFNQPIPAIIDLRLKQFNGVLVHLHRSFSYQNIFITDGVLYLIRIGFGDAISEIAHQLSIGRVNCDSQYIEAEKLMDAFCIYPFKTDPHTGYPCSYMIRVLDGQDDNPFLTLQDIGIWNVVGRKLGFPKYLHLYPKNIRILVESVGDRWVLTLSGETPGGCFYLE